MAAAGFLCVTLASKELGLMHLSTFFLFFFGRSSRVNKSG